MAITPAYKKRHIYKKGLTPSPARHGTHGAAGGRGGVAIDSEAEGHVALELALAHEPTE